MSMNSIDLGFHLGLTNEEAEKEFEGWEENEARASILPAPSLHSQGKLSGTHKYQSFCQALQLGSDSHTPFKL